MALEQPSKEKIFPKVGLVSAGCNDEWLRQCDRLPKFEKRVRLKKTFARTVFCSFIAQGLFVF